MIQDKYNITFKIRESEENTLTGIWNTADNCQMNWVSEGKSWGEMILPEGILGKAKRTYSPEGKLVERYIFMNQNSTDYTAEKGRTGIVIPLPDNYTSSSICMKERCHVHLWCGGNTSYIAAVRMGGKGPNLGMVLTKGSLAGYSIIRNEEAISNDRGTFILHPDINRLEPGEQTEIAWGWFWFYDMDEFYGIINRCKTQISFEMDRAVFFQGERGKIAVHFSEAAKKNEIIIKKNGVSITNQGTVGIQVKDHTHGQTVMLEEDGGILGEQKWEAKVNGCYTWAKTLIVPKVEELAEKRCLFIAEKQQYHNPDSSLDGAFLIYDNEEKKLHYSEVYDHNGGRERVGMGVLIAAYLQKHENSVLEKALNKYTKYIYRELYDEGTGVVYNDVGRNNKWHRLYNYPWMSLFFMERYRLYHEQRDLKNMYRVLCSYYTQGGKDFYAIGIPMTESITLLREAKWLEESEELLKFYKEHGDRIVETGLNYPPHEVNYEQSIVAPAVIYMMQLYQLTGEEKYLNAGKEQLVVLELFNGSQPDYHTYETAIRHWDGYWFGKRKNYGDTFPHYWSALTGLAFKNYARISGDKTYYKRAENSLRGPLSLIFPDGSASCAYVYPAEVNKVKCGYYDPWANDQDWGLYFYLKEGSAYQDDEGK